MMTMIKVGNKWNNAPHALTHCYQPLWSKQPRPNQEINVHVPKARAR
jgi:hypothetical protein